MKSSIIKHETQRAISTKHTYETSQICEHEKHAPGVCVTRPTCSSVDAAVHCKYAVSLLMYTICHQLQYDS